MPEPPKGDGAVRAGERDALLAGLAGGDTIAELSLSSTGMQRAVTLGTHRSLRRVRILERCPESWTPLAGGSRPRLKPPS